MVWPGARDLLFSLKAFAAAMSAFWIACALNLPRPAWAIFTVYILMQPISGAVRSRAVYRMIGTIAGAVIALLLTALLADFPAALFLSIGLATLLGFFVSMIDQTPRGYVYLLAGITTALIGLPDALDPLSGFATAMARTEESLLGIACATVVDTVFFPHPAGAILNARVSAWLRRAQTYTLNALDAAGAPADDHEELGALAADAAQLDALAFHVAYDIVPNRPRPRVVRLLHTRMLLLIRLMFAARDWASAFRSGPGATPRTRQALGAVRDWVGALPDRLRGADRSGAAGDRRAARCARCAGRCDGIAAKQPGADAARIATRPPGLRGIAARGGRGRAVARPSAPRRPQRTAGGAVSRPGACVAGPAARCAGLPAGISVLDRNGLGPGAKRRHDDAGRRPVRQHARPSRPCRSCGSWRIMAVAAAVAIVYQFAVLPGVQGFPLLMRLGRLVPGAGRRVHPDHRRHRHVADRAVHDDAEPAAGV